MDISALYTQIAVMFLLIGVGAVCYKYKLVTDTGSGQMSALLINFAAPAIIIHSFCRAFDRAMLGKLIISFVLSLVLLGISIGIAALVFHKDTADYADKRMCVIFSNNGFMALPLLQALYGDDGVFIGSINIVATNIVIWTFGVWLLTRAGNRGKVRLSWQKILLNPGTIGFFIGLAIFLTSTNLPAVLDEPITFLGNLNTPLAMIVLGVYLAQSNLLDIMKDRSVYLVCLLRLLVIPLITIALMWILRVNSDIANVLIISIATPCAVASSMFAQLYGTNYRYSSRLIAFSTQLSAVTMPVMLSLCALFAV